jgi:hypothetical protein
VLHLPDVAELVYQEVVRGLFAPEQDRPPERVAVITTQAGQAKDPRDDDDANAFEPHDLRIEIEPVETSLRPLEPPSSRLTRRRMLASARVTVLD